MWESLKIYFITSIICGFVYLYFYQYYSSNPKGISVYNKSNFQPTYPVSSRTILFCSVGNSGSDSALSYFRRNCASCHRQEGILVGPPLRMLSTKFDAKWLQGYINNPDSLRKIKDKRLQKITRFKNIASGRTGLLHYDYMPLHVAQKICQW